MFFFASLILTYRSPPPTAQEAISVSLEPKWNLFHLQGTTQGGRGERRTRGSFILSVMGFVDPYLILHLALSLPLCFPLPLSTPTQCFEKKSAFTSQAELQTFLSEVYVYLVDQMHATLNKVH